MPTDELPPEPMSTEQSETLGKLFEALAKAQSEMKPAVMDMKNPHYNSRYASLTSIQDAYREPLAKHGLAVIQQIFYDGDAYWIRTLLGHASGEWISNEFKLLVDKNNMQGLGSAVTYARRYGISSLVGVVDTEDDDGNAAGTTPPKTETKPKPPAENAPKVTPKSETKPKDDAMIYLERMKRLFALADERSWSQEAIKLYIEEAFGIQSTKQLTDEQYADLIATIQKKSYPQAIQGIVRAEPGSSG